MDVLDRGLHLKSCLFLFSWENNVLSFKLGISMILSSENREELSVYDWFVVVEKPIELYQNWVVTEF